MVRWQRGFNRIERAGFTGTKKAADFGNQDSTSHTVNILSSDSEHTKYATRVADFTSATIRTLQKLFKAHGCFINAFQVRVAFLPKSIAFPYSYLERLGTWYLGVQREERMKDGVTSRKRRPELLSEVTDTCVLHFISAVMP